MSTILPGSTIGLLGGGQLGRMIAIAARRLGYRIHVFEPAADGPAGQIADREFNSPYQDPKALKEFAASVDVVTYEFENIPAKSLTVFEKGAPLRPSRDVLFTCQNRRREKEFLSGHGFPVVPFAVVHSEADLAEATATIGFPCVLKTADFGYDGKGQQKLAEGFDSAETWRKHGAAVGVVEKWISFTAEASAIAARGLDGKVVVFPVARNEHRNHILDRSVVPSGLPENIEAEAASLASRLAEALDLVGLLAVEFFVTEEGQLVVNELAPRPHNSGHYTFDACVTSQFEQQLRAVCGLPLGDAALMKPVVMRNLLGDLWADGTPQWDKLLEFPGLKLHLYGKTEARAGRKMGHYCVIANTIQEAEEVDQKAWKLLTDLRS